jgi:hypothetical protein
VELLASEVVLLLSEHTTDRHPMTDASVLANLRHREGIRTYPILSHNAVSDA